MNSDNECLANTEEAKERKKVMTNLQDDTKKSPDLIFDYPPKGITKRELFAAMAMQGMIIRGRKGISPRAFPILSVDYADALIAELGKK